MSLLTASAPAPFVAARAGPGPSVGAMAVVALLAALLGPLAALWGAKAALVAPALPLVVTIAVAPELGAYAWLLIGPLIVGVARGGGLSVLRPNEALLLLVAAGLALRSLWLVARGERWRPTICDIDLAVLLLVMTGSVVPVLLRYGRGLPLTQDDILYALVLVKYFVVYLVFRLGVGTPAQVAACLRLTLVAGAVVGAVALLQVKGLFGVPRFLDAWYDDPFTGSTGPITARGTSTIASSFGVADMMAMCLGIAIAWFPRLGRGRVLLLAGAVLYLAGCVAAGSFSGFIGGAVTALVVGAIGGQLLRLLTILVPTAVIAVVVFWSVVAIRLAGFESRLGLPKSWVGRVENLERFVWPELFSGFNWLWGVRPAARIPAPESWRDFVYIESGYAWLMWIGGVPLLLAFALFVWIVARDLYRIARADKGPVGVAAAAGCAATLMIVVLMALDPHLTVRGCADLFFPLIALALVGRGAGPPAPPRPASKDDRATSTPASGGDDRPGPGPAPVSVRPRSAPRAEF